MVAQIGFPPAADSATLKSVESWQAASRDLGLSPQILPKVLKFGFEWLRTLKCVMDRMEGDPMAPQNWVRMVTDAEMRRRLDGGRTQGSSKLGSNGYGR